MIIPRILLLLVFSTACAVAIAASGSVTINYEVINNFPVRYVAVNMHDPDVLVTTAVASSFPNGLDSWGTFINRLHPDAAINGTYFCPRGYQPVGDVAVDGALLYRGAVGTGFCITPDNQVDMLPGPSRAKVNWTGYRTVLCAGPRLLTDANFSLNARAEGFKDPNVLGSAPRSAIALRKNGILLLLTIERDISLSNLAAVCKRLGAIQAMALDGGSSSGLYANGRTLTRPDRTISNVIAVYANGNRKPPTSKMLVPTPRQVLAQLLSRGNTVTASAPLVTLPVSEPVFDDPTMMTPSATPAVTTSTLLRILTPPAKDTVKGVVPISVKIARDDHIALASLRINGQLRAITNTTLLDYQWDSTKESDGLNTLEITVWSQDRTVLAMDERQVTVKNSTAMTRK